MKVTSKILSIPPYISTTWENISSIHLKEEGGNSWLVVTLKDGLRVEIPSLKSETIATIFNAHAQYIEELGTIQPRKEHLSFTLPFKADGNLIEAFGPTAQHNPEQAHLPPLPPGVLNKITAIATSFGEEALSNLPKSEPNCNCVYCQVMNAIHGENGAGEEVTEEDLRFRSWEVIQTADKLYSVTSPIDTNEHYSVYLGDPIGCTCGEKNCEHIRAVLNEPI